jgi:hypothetical protein
MSGMVENLLHCRSSWLLENAHLLAQTSQVLLDCLDLILQILKIGFHPFYLFSLCLVTPFQMTGVFPASTTSTRTLMAAAAFRST